MARQTVREEQHFWNGVALIVFIVLCAVSVALVARYGTRDFAQKILRKEWPRPFTAAPRKGAFDLWP